MGFWFLDDKTQLALLLAGLMGTGGVAAGCDDGRPVGLDAGPDARPDIMISDMLPPDAQPDVMISDPLPPDARPDVMISDMLPPDASPDVPIADPLPSDASAASPLPPGQGGQGKFQFQLPDRQQAMPTPGRGDRLPLNRSLRTTIQAMPRPDGDGLELTARTRAPQSSRLTYRWRISGGVLDRTDAALVRWTPPTESGRHMAQVTVRDQDRTVFVAVHLHTVE